LERYKIVPSQLKIEITESLLMTNASQTSEVIKQLKEIGLTIQSASPKAPIREVAEEVEEKIQFSVNSFS
jgi:hypothetical protein